jgi:hypothetical protein
MADVVTFAREHWDVSDDSETAEDAAHALERGSLLFFPHLPFAIADDERALFSPAILTTSKNASFDPATGTVGGTTLDGDPRRRLQEMMARFSGQAERLVRSLVPRYRDEVQRARASFRPAEIAGRATSWRKDDTRLHVDAFPASPTQGRRILRVFTNVNPEGRARSWRIGEDFESIAGRFGGALRVPWPGSAAILRALHVTKTRRTPYDALMLQLHDRRKEDDAYQRSSPQTAIDFPPGSTWVAFTDQVSHAAMAGQHQLEQTFLLPVHAMQSEHRSPLRVWERLKNRRLA